VVICLERGADLLMPLPLTISCFSKIQIGCTFLVPAQPGSPEKGPLNECMCSTILETGPGGIMFSCCSSVCASVHTA